MVEPWIEDLKLRVGLSYIFKYSRFRNGVSRMKIVL
jgi:hypothetical protein